MMRFQPLTPLYLLAAKGIHPKLSIQHANKKFFPTKNGSCAVFHGFDSQDDAGLAPRSGFKHLDSHPRSLIMAGLELNKVFCLSLPACSELSHRDGSALKVLETFRVTKCIFVFLFTPLVSTGRLQLDRENNYTSNPLDSSFPSSTKFLFPSLFLKVQLC